MNSNFYIPPNERMGLLFLIILIVTGHMMASLYDKMFGYKNEQKLEIISEILKEQASISPEKILSSALAISQ